VVLRPELLKLTLPTAGVYALFYLSYHPMLQRLPTLGGDPSYGTYLYGFPIQQLIVQRCAGAAGNPLLLAALAMPLSLVAGFASWYLVEKHFLALKPGGRNHDPIVIETTNLRPCDVLPVNS